MESIANDRAAKGPNPQGVLVDPELHAKLAIAIFKNPQELAKALLHAPKGIRTLRAKPLMGDPVVNQGSLTALALACSDAGRWAVATLAERFDPTSREDDGATALHRAASRGVEVIQAALSNRHLHPGFEIDAPDSEGATALMIAAARGSHHSVLALLGAGADSLRRASLGHTALMAAAMTGAEEACAILLTAGSDVDAKDSKGNDALAWARKQGRTKISSMISEMKLAIDEAGELRSSLPVKQGKAAPTL